jgi:hypothetical protein
MVKKIALWLFSGLLLCSSSALGQTARYGLGLIVFDPSGMTAKAWLKKGGTIDGAVGWSAMEGHQLHLHADYLFLNARIASDRNVRFIFYFGIGGKIIFQDHDSAWFRLPVGIDFFIQKTPLNIFFELVPSFNFHRGEVFGAIGLRYLFTR